jgi:hypothetical protein
VTGQEYAVDTVSKDGEIKVNGNWDQIGSILLPFVSSYEGRPCCTVMCEALRFTLAGILLMLCYCYGFCYWRKCRNF